MQRIVTTIEIARPVEEVFDFLTEVDNAPLWAVNLVEVRHDGPLGPAARGTDVRTMGRKQVQMPWEVTRYERPSVVEFTYGKPFPATARFSFVATPQGTRMTCDTSLQLVGLYRLLTPMIVREARRTDAQQFHNAKELLESRAGTAQVERDPATRP